MFKVGGIGNKNHKYFFPKLKMKTCGNLQEYVFLKFVIGIDKGDFHKYKNYDWSKKFYLSHKECLRFMLNELTPLLIKRLIKGDINFED
jgi:hypothetical protein